MEPRAPASQGCHEDDISRQVWLQARVSTQHRLEKSFVVIWSLGYILLSTNTTVRLKTTSNARENIQRGHNPTPGICFHSSTHM